MTLHRHTVEFKIGLKKPIITMLISHSALKKCSHKTGLKHSHSQRLNLKGTVFKNYKKATKAPDDNATEG